MPEPVLLTGASGFVGRAVLAELVARGIPVHAVSRRLGAARPGVAWHQADLLTPQGRAQVAGLAPRLIHCAWEVEHGVFWTSPANAAWHAASLDLVRRFRAAGGGHVMALGTCAEYCTGDPGPWNEERPIRPATLYGQAKAALWRDLSDLCGDDLTWVRLFHLFGPGEDPRRFVSSMILSLSAGQRTEVRSPHLVRDYAPTAHVARCLVGLLSAPTRGACDLSSGHPLSLGDLAHMIARALDATHLLFCPDSPRGEAPERMAPKLVRLSRLPDFQRTHPESAMRELIMALTEKPVPG
jgi:nucleoside-diphosphate-sugar epimerase